MPNSPHLDSKKRRKPIKGNLTNTVYVKSLGVEKRKK